MRRRHRGRRGVSAPGRAGRPAPWRLGLLALALGALLATWLWLRRTRHGGEVAPGVRADAGPAASAGDAAVARGDDARVASVRVALLPVVDDARAGSLALDVAAAELRKALAAHADVALVPPGAGDFTVAVTITSLGEEPSPTQHVVIAEVSLELAREGHRLARLGTRSRFDVGTDASPAERGQARLDVVSAAVQSLEHDLLPLLRHPPAPSAPAGDAGAAPPAPPR